MAATKDRKRPVFREAAKTDLAALHRLIESAYRGDSARRGWTHEADLLGGQRTDREALKAILEDPDQTILLALSAPEPAAVSEIMTGSGIVGCVQLSAVGNGKAYLGLLTVDPDQQASGLGRVILRESEIWVRDHWQARSIEMTVIRQRTDLIGYYERRGYQQTGEHRPFPLDDPRYGLPKNNELEFTVLQKDI